MPKPKPKILTRQLWGRHVALEVKIDSGENLRREISSVRRVLNSAALGEILLLMVKGANSPSELGRQTGKSKYAVSVQLAALKRIGLVKTSNLISSDMRRKRYEIVWTKVGEIFRQDHALELEIYESQLSAERVGEAQGSISRVGLAISGNGKLGLVREIVSRSVPPIEMERADDQINKLIWEFVEFFKGYAKERRFSTLHEYFLAAYEELSEHYGRLPQESELGRFYEFIERAFTRITPIEQIWKKYIPRGATDYPALYKVRPKKQTVIKLFAEAGSADSAGRYILNAEAQPIIKPGTPLKIYPAYTYG